MAASLTEPFIPPLAAYMRILITGGTGFIGKALCQALLGAGHRLWVLTRRPQVVQQRIGSGVVALADLSAWTQGMAFDAIINLAGEPIMARRWSPARKQVLWGSRVTLTQQLIGRMAEAEVKPRVLISGSAIGFYGDRGDQPLTESAERGTGFGHELCAAWEAAALDAESLGVRVCLLRTGLVVGRQGGFLKPMLLPFRLGLGGRLGDGQQWMSWIHLADHVALTLFLLETASVNGVFNATAPQPVTNRAFTQTLAQLLHRPALLPLPAWLLKLAAGEMAELLLASQRVLPERALASGFRFSHETLQAALEDVLVPATGPH